MIDNHLFTGSAEQNCVSCIEIKSKQNVQVCVISNGVQRLNSVISVDAKEKKTG